MTKEHFKCFPLAPDTKRRNACFVLFLKVIVLVCSSRLRMFICGTQVTLQRPQYHVQGENHIGAVIKHTQATGLHCDGQGGTNLHPFSTPSDTYLCKQLGD